MAKGIVAEARTEAVGHAGADKFHSILKIAALAAAVLLFVPLFVPLMTGRVFAIDDLAVFHLPLRVLYAAALSEGDSILWTPHLFNGFYIHAEGQLGALHPVHLLIYRFLPVAAGFNLELILSYAAAFGGMWVFLGRVGLSGAAAIVGASAFAFCGSNLLRISQMNVIAIAAHIPWLLASIEVLLSGSPRTRALAFAAVSFLVGSQVLLGYPQYVWLSALICGIYALVGVPQGIGWSRVASAGAAAVVGLAMGGVQLVPTLDLVAKSLRASVPSSFFLTFSLHPLNFLQLWSPYIFPERVYALPGERFIHEFGVYSGSLCT
ncbi:MAG: hypothetical protein LC804_26895, partial [Acidobacteria bacterium]|nr:hypothetical protein [Acidobacteriota bacterium]